MQYSGMGCVEQSMVMVAASLDKLGVCKLDDLDIVVKELWDLSSFCRKVLMAFKCDAEHVFGNLLDRISGEARTQIEEVVFPRPVPLVLEEKDPAEFQSLMQIYGALAHDTVNNIHDIFELNKTRLWQPGYTASCYLHKRVCPVWREPQCPRAEFNVAGSTCINWSTVWSRNGLSGVSAFQFYCWLHEQKARSVPRFLHECTPQFLPQLIRNMFMQDAYEVTSVIAGPGMMIIPTDRQQIFALVLRRDTYFMTNPFAAFVDIVARAFVLDGGIFFIAPAHLAEAEIAERNYS